ncbi:Pr6Pr family membrane protein [Microbacterium sp. SORGH_AS_0888]|uniref:Pr6Pr family membrane protein n=1 Tax=Microbacterium sp. SORGH_AS_0888 TaxID=3041791 RepID=UPI0027D7FF59|nr:Pr6Pr family membrane protein [Microbacterium sp. SORGH_AS_0888]
MFLADRRIALGYRVVAALLILWGVLRVTGTLDGRFSGVAFLYFTVLSNLLCIGWFVALAVATVRDLARTGPRGPSAPWPRTGGAVMMAITVTMLTYPIVLAPEAFTQGSGYTPFTLTDDLIHIVAPVLTILDWLLFTPKGSFRWYDPPLWALIPYIYLAFAFAFAYGAAGGVFGAAGSRYPYPFMSVPLHGVGGVALWILALTVAMEVIAFAYVAVDRALGRVRASRAERGVGP